MKSIAIVGGGFCGVMTAVNLSRFASTPISVMLINSGRPLGEGAAYSTRRPEHLLNVTASKMSAYPDDTLHFVNWLKRHRDYAQFPLDRLREMFIPRRDYGEYLKSQLAATLQAPGQAEITTVEGEVIDCEGSDEHGYHLRLSGGKTLAAEQVVLATGNSAPAVLMGRDGPFVHPGYVSDPWGPWTNQLGSHVKSITLIGTGLTMVDVFLTLSSCRWQGTITAVSRNGLLPHAHFSQAPAFPSTTQPPERLQGLVRHLLKQTRQLKRNGQPIAAAVDRLRGSAQKIWRGFSLEEKRLFLSRYSAAWNVLRHRLPETIDRNLSAALNQGQLRIERGSLQYLSEHGHQVQLHLKRRSGADEILTSDLVINCSGPQLNFRKSSGQLGLNLLERGLIREDPIGLGIDATPDFQTISAAGEASQSLFAIGPMLKGNLWESTAVPELREQARRLARILTNHEEPAISFCEAI